MYQAALMSMVELHSFTDVGLIVMKSDPTMTPHLTLSSHPFEETNLISGTLC